MPNFFRRIIAYSEIFRIFAPRTSGLKKSSLFLLLMHLYFCSILLVNEADALLSCTLESGKFKQRTRRGTTVHVYIRGLVVSCSFLYGNPEPECEDVGYASPRSFVYNTSQKHQQKIFCIWDHTTCEGMYDPQSFSFRN